MSSGAAGVGRTPPSSTSPPALATPAASAASSISPDSRVSRMTSTRGWSPAISAGAGLGGHAAAAHAGDDVHAVLVADRLERLPDVALERRAREELVHRLAVDGVRAGAGLEDDAGDRRLALAGRGVARVGGQVDRDGRDRLLDGVLVGGRELLVG